jgi:hypothetical protein
VSSPQKRWSPNNTTPLARPREVRQVCRLLKGHADPEGAVQILRLLQEHISWREDAGTAARKELAALAHPTRKATANVGALRSDRALGSLRDGWAAARRPTICAVRRRYGVRPCAAWGFRAKVGVGLIDGDGGRL